MPTTHLNPPSPKPTAFNGADLPRTQISRFASPAQLHLSGNSILETRDGSNDLLQQYVHGLSYVDELVELAFAYYPPGATTCDNFYAVLQDANYNVLGLVESYYGFGLTERYEYSPYGKRQVLYCSGGSDLACYVPLSQSLTCNWIGTLFNEFGHQGLLHDEETGLIYNRARFLHPTLGRFMQQDPKGYVEVKSLYTYEASNPIVRLDNDGFCSCGPDITDALNDLLADIDRKLKAMSFRDLCKVCIGRFDSGAWDTDLFTKAKTFDDPTCGKCESKFKPAGKAYGQSVTINGKCYGSYDVNYILWGRLNKNCAQAKEITEGAIIFQKVKNYGGEGLITAATWSAFGEFGTPPIDTRTDLKTCTSCANKWTGKIGWHVNNTPPSWWPMKGLWPW